MPAANVKLGLASAFAIVFIWSGFIVFSRSGVVSGLTAYDVTALRFVLAGAVTLPFVVRWWPRQLPLKVQVLLAICGPGALYAILMFLGLGNASAAYGGVFANGSLPVFTALTVLLVTGIAPRPGQILAFALIILGGGVLGYRGMTAATGDVATGILLFLAASAIISIYIFCIGHWQVTPRQALAVVNVPNALLFLPIWWFFLPSRLAEAEVSTIVFQALFQGIGPGFLAVILFALAVRHLGAAMTSGFAAVVPATAALLAIPVLGERPDALEWLGIAIVSAGLTVLVLARR